MKTSSVSKMTFMLPAGIVVILGCAAAMIDGQKIPTLHDTNMTPVKPRIIIIKSRRTLSVYDGEKLIARSKVVLGSSPIGDKEIEGDGRTPEGKFYIFVKNPESKFFLSLGVSYPSAIDAQRGLRKGLITDEEARSIVAANAVSGMPLQKTALGGEIYIHGGGLNGDWTNGCIALTNEDMAKLFAMISVGTEVVIKP